MRLSHIPLVILALACMNCHPGPVIGGGPKAPVGGTIAGIVSTDTKAAVMGRKVTAVDTATGTRYDATTGVNGGYTIKVPEGTYRLEVELRPGETVAKQPNETRVNKSDLDPHRDFVIAVGRTAGARPTATRT
jgi:Carboxypeptidase regulatory-like domain